VANAVPLLFSAAGRVPGTASAPALAAVFTMGYAGFIVGPPVIGILADAIGLSTALALLCAAGTAVAVFGGRATHAAEPLRVQPASAR
jgi:MFS family permease